MKALIIAATAAASLVATAASAQTAPAPAPAPAHDHHAADHHAAHPTIDSTIEALVADPATKAVLDKHLPGIDRHPAYAQFKGMTLRQVAPFSQGNITDVPNETDDDLCDAARYLVQNAFGGGKVVVAANIAPP
jgi:hypothetical protein